MNLIGGGENQKSPHKMQITKKKKKNNKKNNKKLVVLMTLGKSS